MASRHGRRTAGQANDDPPQGRNHSVRSSPSWPHHVALTADKVHGLANSELVHTSAKAVPGLG
jgi:hypothetical protein